MKILFLDDEKNILNALQRTFKRKAHEWEMIFIADPSDALEKIKGESFEVIVSDLRLPGMTGEQFLQQVAEISPGVHRIMLSGDPDMFRIAQKVGIAHYYLPKPFELDQLYDVIQCSARIRHCFSSSVLLGIMAEMGELPSLPQVYNELMEAISNESVSTEMLGEIIARDLALSANVLRMINSSYYGLNKKVSNPVDATVYLGMDTIRSIVLANSTLTQFQIFEEVDWLTERVEEGLHLSQLAKKVANVVCANNAIVAEQAFQAALLHEIGRILIAAQLPSQHEQIEQNRVNDNVMLVDAERAILGEDHTLIGAYLLSLWGFDNAVLEAILFHHRPAEIETNVINASVIFYYTLLIYQSERQTQATLCVPICDALIEKFELDSFEAQVKDIIQGRQDNG